MPSTLRAATSALAVSALLTGSALASDMAARLGALRSYAAVVDSVLGDGIAPGEIATVREATANLTAQIDGILDEPYEGPMAECTAEIAGAVDDVRADLQLLADGQIALDEFMKWTVSLRRMADGCTQVWNRSR